MEGGMEKGRGNNCQEVRHAQDARNFLAARPRTPFLLRGFFYDRSTFQPSAMPRFRSVRSPSYDRTDSRKFLSLGVKRRILFIEKREWKIEADILNYFFLYYDEFRFVKKKKNLMNNNGIKFNIYTRFISY